MKKRWWILIGVALLVGAFLLGRGFRTTSEQQTHHAAVQVESNVERKAGLVNYENALEACKSRGNEGRENELKLAEGMAEAERPNLYVPGREVAHNLKTAEYANPDGTIKCTEAIKKP